MKQETMQKVEALIYTASDAECMRIQEALLNRRARLRDEARNHILRTIRVGDRVRLKNVKPKYLIGTPGTVIEIRGTKFVVELDANCDIRARKRFGGTPLCPATILESI